VRRALLLTILVACRAGFDPIDRKMDGGPMDGAGDAITAIDAIDAAPGVCVVAACQAAGGMCQANTCVIARTSESAVTCPDGMACRVECTGSGRPCRDGASCGGATVCELRCIGYRACQDGAACMDSECTVTCDGPEACEAGITVGPGGTCTSHCCGDAETCAGGVATCTNDAICS